MKKLLLLLILSFFSAQGLAAGCPDGSEPVKSISADGTYFVYNCGGISNTATSNSDSSSNKTSKVDFAKSGISIENDPNVDFFLPPRSPPPNIFGRTHGGRWRVLDMNNDGISDVVYVFSMDSMPDKAIGVDTAGACGGPACEGFKPQPSLYLGDPDGKLHFSPELIIDNRKEPGISGGGQQLFADFNGDKVLDIYIGDHGLGTHDGHRDSYYLSQPNGTWVESSDTHLSHSNFKVFNHGDATGDIDNDGDMDVVITDLKGHFWCLVNDGSGFLTKRMCGGVFSFALELADMDSDGDLDALVGVHEFDSNNRLTGVVWNDGQGNFAAYNTTSFKQYKNKWGGVPEVSAADLDGDGDLDVVYSRVGELYVGTAVQIIENLGNKKFKDHGIISIVEAPADYVPKHEANEWNHFIQVIHFRDIDNDGDQDIFFQTRKNLTRGGLLINNGGFNFDYISPPKALDYYKKLDNSSIVISNEVLKSRAKVKETKYSKKFESSIKKHGKVTFEGEDYFMPFDIPIPLVKSGALLMGFNDLVYSQAANGTPLTTMRVHLKFGGDDISTNMRMQYYPEHKFPHARLSFLPKDWGGIVENKNFVKTHTKWHPNFIGHWENEGNITAMEELGIAVVLKDVQIRVKTILEALDKQKALYFEARRSPLFDGRYSFDLFRYSDDEGDRKLGNALVEIINGEIIIDKDNRELKEAGSSDLYDTFSGQVDKKGMVSASMELNVELIDESKVYDFTPEFYEFNGSIKDKKIWGDPLYHESSFKAYLLLEAVETIVSSPLFDGRYSFDLFRYHDDEDWQELGNGFVEIRNGIMTVAKEGRTLDTGSIDLYDSFEGQIDKKGNIKGSLKINVLTGKTNLFLVDLNGSIDSQLQGEWDHYYDVILKLGEKE